jgi:hypothetical protein
VGKGKAPLRGRLPYEEDAEGHLPHHTIAEDPQNPGKQVIAVMYEQEQPLEFDEF